MLIKYIYKHRFEVIKSWKDFYSPMHIASDLSLSLNVCLALERYLKVCHPLLTVRYPLLKNSLLYIGIAIVFNHQRRLLVHHICLLLLGTDLAHRYLGIYLTLIFLPCPSNHGSGHHVSIMCADNM